MSYVQVGSRSGVDLPVTNVTIRELVRTACSYVNGDRTPRLRLIFISLNTHKKNPVTKQVTVIIIACEIVGHCTG